MADLGMMLESFPFDSDPDLTYDENGDPRYDRAVGAHVLRETFAKFFSSGVFPSPASSLRVTAAGGLRVTVEPGSCVINGAMGGLYEPTVLTLDTAAPQGNVRYGVFLRFDNNRYEGGAGQAIFLRVGKGQPSADPVPPEPDRTTPGVYELRLASVLVKSGSASAAASGVADERGSDVCPFAAPFEEIDVSALFDQIRADGQEKLEWFQQVIDQYKGLLDSALGDSVAAELQRQITELRVGMTDAEFVAYVTGGA